MTHTKRLAGFQAEACPGPDPGRKPVGRPESALTFESRAPYPKSTGHGRRGVALTLSALAATAALAGVAHADEPVYDPWEPFNRTMFAVHETVDRYALEPVARAYEAVTPAPVREGVGNLLDNLKAPVVLANDVLQLQPGRAATTTGRFLINSTLGVGGIFDVASVMGLEKHDEDFGQTLATWGVPSGPYLFIPVLGPSNLRDGVGRGVDGAIDPINTEDFRSDDDIRAGRATLTGLNTRADILGAVDDVRATSDPYLTIRTTYQLIRETEIRNGKAELDALPESIPEPMPDAVPEEPPAAAQPQSPPMPPQ